MRPTFSIIIPAYNEAGHIGACLRSVFGQRCPGEKFEVIVVDNGSTDRTVAIAEEFPAMVLADPAKTVAGLRNLGARSARGAILAFVDADCTVATDWLEAAEGYAADARIAAWGAPPKPPADGTWVQRTWYLVRRKPGVQDVRWLESMNLFVRKSDFEAIGGFNEYLETCEDVDFCYRAALTGRVVADERIRAYHLGEAATLRHFYRKERWRGRGNLAGMFRHGLSLKELPSLALPLYLCIGPPLAILTAILTASRLWAALAVMLMTAPGLAVVGRFFHRGVTLSLCQGVRLMWLLQVYFLARVMAILPGR